MAGELSYRLAQARYYLLVTLDRLGLTGNLGKVLAVLLVLGLGGGAVMTGGFGLLSRQGQDEGAQQVDATPAPVPDVLMRGRGQAQETLRAAGFTSVQEKQLSMYAGSSGDEVVLEQSPTAGVTAPRSGQITLSYGSKTLYEKAKTVSPVPAVKGMGLPQALATIKKSGFVNVTYTVPPGKKPETFVVSSVSPLAATKVPQSTRLSLALEEGLNIREFTGILQKSYVAYNRRIAGITSLGGRAVGVTLRQRDPRIKNQLQLNEAARIYKVSFEQLTGESLEKVILTMPGFTTPGDSTRALRDITTTGLTVAAAQEACEEHSRTAFEVQPEFNWERGRQKQEILANAINLTAWASILNDNDVAQNVVIQCTVAGTNENPQVTAFQAD